MKKKFCPELEPDRWYDVIKLDILRSKVCWLVGWFVGLVGWLVCWFGWLVCWLVGWFVGWLVGWLSPSGLVGTYLASYLHRGMYIVT